MKTITGWTTLHELELALLSHGLTLVARPLPVARVGAVVTDERGVTGEAICSSLPEAIDAAVKTYLVNVFGPPARAMTCPKCDGAGGTVEPGTPPLALRDCPRCGGLGKVTP